MPWHNQGGGGSGGPWGGGGRRLPIGEECADPFLLGAEVRGGRQRGTAAPQRQIVNQDDSVAVSNRTYLVDAVRVECGEGDLGGLLGAQVDDRLALLVADDQLASGARHRQGQHEGGDHAVLLLGIPVGGEEPATLVDQQLVQMCAGTCVRSPARRTRRRMPRSAANARGSSAAPCASPRGRASLRRRGLRRRRCRRRGR